MCSNFGLNLHPGRPPAELENRVYRIVRGWLEWIRRRSMGDEHPKRAPNAPG